MRIHIISDFNSIKVRLERSVRCDDSRLATFQFHKGTIRTKHRIHNITSNLHFNSIKVRLEPRNSNLPLDAVKFQFHKGTIRTQKLMREEGISKISIP